MSQIKKAILIILDGVGIGEAPDAADFGDVGSHTLGNIAKEVGGLELPHLQKLGLGNIEPLQGMSRLNRPLANYGRMQEQSPGKDSTSGHWEIAGYILKSAFPTYPDGFPPEVMEPFQQQIGRGTLGNKPASGTEIIRELGNQHMKTGFPIVYTSADSVFQIAAHEKIIPPAELYQMCRIARKILCNEHSVSRVIARPFIGENQDTFVRTRGRRDFSVKPPGILLQNCFQRHGFQTVGIGKIDDLYAGVGLDQKIHTKSTGEGIDILIRQIKMLETGLIMINLVDFDMLWGHRNDPHGFYRELRAFDNRLLEILNLLKDSDLMIITADHGNDPTTPSTDHSREFVPVLFYGPGIQKGINVGDRKTFADIGRTVTEAFEFEDCQLSGSSFWPTVS